MISLAQFRGNEMNLLYERLAKKNAEYAEEIEVAKEQRNVLNQHIFDVLHNRGKIDYAVIAETLREIVAEVKAEREVLADALTPDVLVTKEGFFIERDNGMIAVELTFQIDSNQLEGRGRPPLVIVPKDSYEMLEIKLRHLQGSESEAYESFTFYDVVKEAIRKDASDIHFNYVGDLYYTLFRIAGRAVVQQHFTMNTEKAEIFFNEVRQKMSGKGGFKTEEYNLPQGASTDFPELGVRPRGEFAPSGQFDRRNRFVCRILKKPTGRLRTIDDLRGYDPDFLKLLKKATIYAKGLFLVTGVTNSGKSTLTSHFINSIPNDRIIATIEDPIEYDKSRPNTTQHQVILSDDEKTKVDFLRYIKSGKRSDLDVTEIGEIRKDEDGGNRLMEAVVEGVKAGDFTISTTHIDSAFDVPLAMVNMYGVDRYVVADLLVFVIAQTLVEKLCPHCRIEDHKQVNREILREWLELGDVKYAWRKDLEEFINSDQISYIKNPNGCPHCDHTGIDGLVPIYEYYKPDVEMIMWLNKNLDTINKFDIELEFCKKEKKHLARNMLSVFIEKLINGEVDTDERTLARVLMS